MPRIDERVLKRMRQVGGMEVDEVGGDLSVSVLGGHPVRFRVESKARISADEFEDLLPRLGAGGAPRLLITRELPPRRRQALIAQNGSWVEYGTGFVHLRAPGIAVDLPEDPSLSTAADRRSDHLPGLEGKAGVVVEVLIELSAEQPLVEQAVIARISGCNQGWVSQVFSALVTAGALEEVGSGPRKRWRPRPDELFDLWIRDGGPNPEATPLFVWARASRELLQKVASIEARELRYALGGVAAANLYAPFLTEPPHPEIWIPAALPVEALAERLGGEIVESGANMWAWQAPGDPALQRARPLGDWRGMEGEELADLRIVSPPRAAAEAALGRGRAPEVAERLREMITHRSGEGRGSAE